MSARFRRGLVVGKFCPLHRGHELVISRACTSCDEVVVISYAKPGFASCPRAARDAWIAARFPQAVRLVIDDDHLAECCRAEGLAGFPSIPPDDAPDDIHRRFVARLCSDLLRRPVDAVFTSEDYGDGFAAVLAAHFGHPVRHVCVDRARTAVPISGTALRADPHRHRHFLAPEVYAHFVKRICLLGGESTGKTTLAAALAERLQTTWAPEYGRELWDKKEGHLVFADMVHIGRMQLSREAALAGHANHYLICDTSPLTTLFYSLALFGGAEPELESQATRHYDLVFLCRPDFPFVQDGTRQDEAFRRRQDRWYSERLGESFVPLHGSPATRLATAMEAIARL